MVIGMLGIMSVVGEGESSVSFIESVHEEYPFCDTDFGFPAEAEMQIMDLMFVHLLVFCARTSVGQDMDMAFEVEELKLKGGEVFVKKVPACGFLGMFLGGVHTQHIFFCRCHQ